MTRIWYVARREYLETVRSGTFILLMTIFPIMLVLSIAVPRLLEKSSGPSKIALVDLPAEWVRQINEAYGRDDDVGGELTLIPMDTPGGEKPEEHLRDLQAQVRQTRLFGYVTVGANDEGERVTALTTRNAGEDSGARWLKRNLPTVMRMERASKMGLKPDQVWRLTAPIEIPTKVLDAAGGEKEATDTDRLTAFAPMIFTYLLWIVVFTLNQRLLMSTIEEKSARTIEIILSSCSPLEFMAGKVLSGVLEGITVLGVWLGTLYFAADYFTKKYLHGLNLTVLFSRHDHMIFFGVYFTLGFILFSALTVGIGSLCNTIKDTQGLMTPLSLLMVVPLLVMQYVGQHPGEPLSVALSWFPFFTPFLMMNRIAANPPPGTLELIASFATLAASIYACTWAGAKMFRVGILMYGKAPRLGAVLKMLMTREARAT